MLALSSWSAAYMIQPHLYAIFLCTELSERLLMNSSTVFIGNGINNAIILVERRRQGSHLSFIAIETNEVCNSRSVRC